MEKCSISELDDSPNFFKTQFGWNEYLRVLNFEHVLFPLNYQSYSVSYRQKVRDEIEFLFLRRYVSMLYRQLFVNNK